MSENPLQNEDAAVRQLAEHSARLDRARVQAAVSRSASNKAADEAASWVRVVQNAQGDLEELIAYMLRQGWLSVDWPIDFGTEDDLVYEPAEESLGLADLSGGVTPADVAGDGPGADDDEDTVTLRQMREEDERGDE